MLQFKTDQLMLIERKLILDIHATVSKAITYEPFILFQFCRIFAKCLVFLYVS